MKPHHQLTRPMVHLIAGKQPFERVSLSVDFGSQAALRSNNGRTSAFSWSADMRLALMSAFPDSRRSERLMSLETDDSLRPKAVTGEFGWITRLCAFGFDWLSAINLRKCSIYLVTISANRNPRYAEIAPSLHVPQSNIS